MSGIDFADELKVLSIDSARLTGVIVRRMARTKGRISARFLMAALVVGLLGTGCSTFKRVAINKLGNGLAGAGDTFASDDDPELIKAAVPFSLKLMESLLAESPEHKGLLLALSSGFTQYTYAFVQEDADEVEEKDLTAATQARVRSKKLYLRARNYGMRGLELQHKNFEKALRADPRKAVRITTAVDVPLLYWTAVSWGSVISLSKDNPELIAELPIVEALIDRALELNERFDHGAIHSFLIPFSMSRPGDEGALEAVARKHFERAVELSGGQLAGPYVSLAETVSVQKQNLTEFNTLLNRALAINPDAKPEWRLSNLIMQRRAQWLLTRTDELFLIKDKKSEKSKL
jgi:predicted anti-sigma-YlaC factor YlaD